MSRQQVINIYRNIIFNLHTKNKLNFHQTDYIVSQNFKTIDIFINLILILIFGLFRVKLLHDSCYIEI